MLSKDQLLERLEGNRRLTVRTIEAFPEDELFSYKPAEALRPFAEMVLELIGIESGYVRGIATGEWVYNPPGQVAGKQELLAALEAVRAETLRLWPAITTERLAEVEQDPFWGPAQSHFDRLFYALENEIHHRGQGYIYLRELGIEPPAFYER